MDSDIAAVPSSEGTSELPFERPLTAREEAAARDRSKREAEMAELRRLRSEKAGGIAGLPKFGSQSSSSEAAKKKREKEMEEIRRLKAGENEEQRRRLSTMGGPLTTDMDQWRSNQWGAKDADRKKKLEAQSNLQGHRGYHETKTEAALDKDAFHKTQKEKAAAMKAVDGENGEDLYPGKDGSEWLEEESCVKPATAGVKFKDAAAPAMPSNVDDKRRSMNAGKQRPSLRKLGDERQHSMQNVMFKDAEPEQIPVTKEGGRLRVSFSSKVAVPIASEDGAPEEGDKQDAEEVGQGVSFKGVDEQISVAKMPIAKEGGKAKVSFSNNVSATIAPEDAPPLEEEVTPKVKFAEAPPAPTAAEPEPEKKMPPDNARAAPAIAAAVEQSHPEEEIKGQEEEKKPKPSEEKSVTAPPTYSRVDIKFSFGLIVRSSAADGFETENLRDNETLRKCMEGTSKILHVQLPSPPDVSDITAETKFPESYYDPTLEPTVISIEEDERKESDKAKAAAKGNKRTLVKASFPVFLREEVKDEEGKKRSARMLKETKTTVFKALRAAVSGGSFLR